MPDDIRTTCSIASVAAVAKLIKCPKPSADDMLKACALLLSKPKELRALAKELEHADE